MLLEQELLSSYEETLINLDYRQRLEKIARKYTRGTGLSWEDAYQIAYLKIFVAFQAGKFRQGNREQFYYWAVAVARCVIIDFVRKESLRKCQSLDDNIPGTDISLLDTIPDEFSSLDAIERADLIVKTLESIYQLDKSYPHRNYLKLWQGKVDGKTQTQIAAELSISQGEVSKRWQELSGRIAELLGLLELQEMKDNLQKIRQKKTAYNRSTKQW
ncbi:sigma-70 family RNA polymerase sigma factor [Nostoc spongiaeforme FACHB-130]|uniref:Sigma-70 family RNA polymerase sigma factor n=1 Tax=Nostoc spongiaeforme FACHB-130 TaxID=1357510 RepID=A0ABR8FUH6_9NOSO|nr:sigma-70 family RNA polymerase sigma factor [Nostoc spongiaeforme]MBD2593892.1 sigma-70 family RNA polymerase sigma factor [Nostoc spongiaeforme FACHB-130]